MVFEGRVPEDALPALQECALVIAPLGNEPPSYEVDGKRCDVKFVNAGRLTWRSLRALG